MNSDFRIEATVTPQSPKFVKTEKEALENLSIVPSILTPQSVKRNNPIIPFSQHLQASVVDSALALERLGIAPKKHPASIDVVPPNPVEKLAPSIKKRLNDLLNILNSKAFLFETGSLITAIHVHVEDLFRQAANDGLLDQRELPTYAYHLKELCFFVNSLEFYRVLEVVNEKNHLLSTIVVLEDALKKIADDPRLRLLKPVNRANIVSKRQGVINSILEPLRLVRALVITESGYQVLTHSCDKIIPKNERVAFDLPCLFSAIEARYRIILADFNTAVSKEMLNLAELDPAEKRSLTEFANRMKGGIGYSHQEFSDCMKRKDLNSFLRLYHQFSLIVADYNHRNLPVNCDQILSNLSLDQTVKGLATCLSLATDGVRLGVEKRQLSEDEIGRVEECLDVCMDISSFSSRIDWVRYCDVYSLLKNQVSDLEDLNEAVFIVEQLRKQTEKLAALWISLDDRSDLGGKIRIIRESHQALDPRDLYSCRTTFVNEVGNVVDEFIQAIDILRIADVLERLEKYPNSIIVDEFAKFVIVILGGIHGTYQELQTVGSILGVLRKGDIALEPDSSEEIKNITASQKNKASKKTRKKNRGPKASSAKGKRQQQVTASNDNTKDSPLGVNDNDNGLGAMLESRSSGRMFETENELSSFISEMVKEPLEPATLPLVIPAPLETEEELVIKEVMVEEKQNTPQLAPQVPVKEKKKTKERIDYSGKARSLRSVIERLTQHNYHLVRQKGSHAQMKNPDTGDLVTLPKHGKPICRRALRDLETRFAELNKKGGITE